jgi:hypothetical protein
MPDVTNQQLLKAINANQELLVGVAQTVETIVDNMVTKKDLDERLKDFATKDDLKLTAIRLERKIDANSAANVKHHLETRKMIGDLNKQYGAVREGLAKAVRPV